MASPRVTGTGAEKGAVTVDQREREASEAAWAVSRADLDRVDHLLDGFLVLVRARHGALADRRDQAVNNPESHVPCPGATPAPVACLPAWPDVLVGVPA
ncbi:MULTISPECIES: hypothetical protein [Streptomyces]|uniref:hypothetical protein n=1 Tax=Streptomyces TaxID=1883 RepID=UPI0021A2A880|nr:hypothetical protein [Streptomyces atratus]MCT2546716.1 hypothetical protein [Streptomyces atratus]